MSHQSTVNDSLADMTTWEHWLEKLFIWTPYVSLAASFIVSQIGEHPGSERWWLGLLAVTATAWTFLLFTRLGRPLTAPQQRLRLYFVGFVVLSASLVLIDQVYLIYGITGFFHAALLRPWWLSFTGIAAAGFVVHAHIVITRSLASDWVLYVGVVAVQTVAVGFGIYGGERMTEIAEERRRMVERLQMAMDENVGLHAQLVAQAREAGTLDERQRMAREIHDTIAQGLTGVITQIEAIHQSFDDTAEVQRRLKTAADLARQSLEEARRSVQAIRPAQLDDSRLPDAIADIATHWSETSGIPVEVNTIGDRRALRPELEVTLLRVAQEGLANVGKHSGATRAGVTLTFMADSVTLDVRDDGSGFDASKSTKPQSFGLVAMQQRIEHVHGRLHIESAPGEGTAISVNVPTAGTGVVQ